MRTLPVPVVDALRRVPFLHSACERRWPHADGDQHGEILGGDAGVACAYCGEAVSYTDSDPIGLGVVERWKPNDEDIDWMVFAHRACFIERLHADVRETDP